MKTNKLNNRKYNFLLLVGIIMSFVIPSLSKESIIDFDNKIDIKGEIQASSNDIKSQIGYKMVNNENIYTLSDVIKKCSKEIKTKFYKSIVIVNGRLASADEGIIKECLDNNYISSINIFANKNKDERCICIFHQLECSWFDFHSCDPAVCHGPCNNKLYSNTIEAGYTNMSDLFNEVPEEVAEGFVGSFVINNGRIDGCYYGEILSYLGKEKTRELLKNIIIR